MAKIKDPVSGFSHLIGVIGGIVGLVFLIILSSIHGNAFTVVSFTLFGTTLVLLYSASTLYHLLNLKEKRN